MIADSNGPIYASIFPYIFPKDVKKISEHWAQNVDPYEYDTSVIITIENHWTSQSTSTFSW